ncbi:hypothetical protein KEM56_001892 [Ascosphaera pollenicola]|nr:hypothetical protein KEM56_001892 [Ascosphaera pollenicola]
MNKHRAKQEKYSRVHVQETQSNEDLANVVNALKADANIMKNDMADMARQHASQMALLNAQIKQVVQNAAAIPQEASHSSIPIPLPQVSPAIQDKPNTPLPGMSTLMYGFAPTSATDVPFMAPEVDMAALLAQRSSHRMRKEDDPANKMDGKNKREYKPWLRAVLLKLLGDLSSTMTNLVTARPDIKFPELIQKIENFMKSDF